VPQPNPYANAPALPEGEDLDPGSLFQGEGPVELEIGPGRGGFAFERLAARPDVRLLGLEIRRKWATIVDQRLDARGLRGRGRVFAEDARFALPRLRAGTVSAVYIHFPDPWWKKRHKKRLVASVDLLREIVRLLVPGGELFFQTDVAERAEQFEGLVDAVPALAPWGETPRISDNPYGAMSPRERRAVTDGLPIVRLRYRKIG
jgi:tRNA (guanine-N7-)-methyltransferase